MPDVFYGTPEYRALVRIASSERLNEAYFALYDMVMSDQSFAAMVNNPMTTEDAILARVPKDADQ